MGNRVQLIDKDYTTSNCKCRIRDVACKVCGNVIGYHITQPCQQCLKAPNNGHFWMFHTDGVVGQERLSMDLKKLVEELVRGPETPAPAAPTVTPPPGMTSATTSTAPGVAPDAATTRLTSVSRLQRLQRQQQRQANSVESMLSSRVLTTSPLPATLTNMSSGRHITSSPSPAYADGEQQGQDEQGFESRHDLGRYSASSPSKTAYALSTLTLSQFLQPMKWENLPNPDLDIDLDPNIMGGEPLFANQWTDIVLRYAEAAAVNLSLALDQEEETNRFMDEVMQEQEERRRLLTKQDGHPNGDNDKYEVNEGDDDVDEVIELIPEMGDYGASLTTTIVELDGVQSEEPMMPARSRRERILESNGEMDLEILIDRVDDIVLNNQDGNATVITIIADDKEEDLTMDIDSLYPSSRRGRTIELRQQESDPGMIASPSAAATQVRQSQLSNSNQQPGQQRNGRRDRDRAHARSASFGGHLPLGESNSNADRTRTRSNSIGSPISLVGSIDLSAVGHENANIIIDNEDDHLRSPPAFALTAAIMAHAAAKAAATDADAASSNLLYGRRTRRDYDSMCR